MMLVPGTPIEIRMWQDEQVAPEAIGRLAMADRRAQLEWSTDVITTGRRIAPLLYPTEAGLHPARSASFEGLHGFLADSLPEGWGALLMKRRLAKLGERWEDLDPLDRLALVGRQGRGALTFEPANTPDSPVESLDLDALASESEAILAGEDADLADTLAKLAGASGGARPKVHVGFLEGGGHCVAESEVAPGFESWIVKFKALTDPVDVGPVEEAYARMARSAGIDMAASRLIPAKDGPGYFAARRFDRPEPGRRLHMVSLAGAIEAPPHLPSLDYDGFLRAVHAITRHEADLTQAFRRMIFNILACNRDDHTRQHAFLMDAHGGWRLAPAYDLTYSTGPGGEHYLAVEGEGRNPTRSHVMALAKRHGLPDKTVQPLIEEVRSALMQWPALASELGATTSRDEITARFEEISKTFG
jgi:serine/threonine-protein kinase HipA